jgi:arginine decarboxylase
MNNFVPTEVFLTKGVGRHKYQLKSFEQALRKAGVAHQNLVKVSSILPSKCKVISRESGLKKLTPGQICHCVRGGRLNKAGRGELKTPLPIGYVYDSESHTIFDPDKQVQERVKKG